MPEKRIINIKLENRFGARWHKYEDDNGQLWIRGTVFIDGQFYKKDDLPTLLVKMAQFNNTANLGSRNFLEQLNGFFALVFKKGHECIAVADRVRSIPVFYAQTDEQIFLSDDAEWLRKSLGVTEADPIARHEFLLTGYVTGSDTLFQGLHQLQAGEMLSITQGDESKVTIQRYYRFLHTEPKESVDEESLLDDLDAISEKCVQRLIDYANGRQIVVPLSGGLDSRLIVTLLRRLEYDNVLTFTYGVPGNYESEVSRSVAASLNYQWEFVPYSNRLWRQWWKSKERSDYQWWASNWTSLASMQDWPAVRELSLAGKLHDCAVFAPGHSADLLAGSRSQSFPLLYNSDTVDLTKAVDAIFNYHYSLFPHKMKESASFNYLHDRIIQNLTPEMEIHSPASIFEAWDVSERQAKFIINSTRVYEYWGYDWYLPYWDKKFMLFWQNVPNCLRVNKILYDRYVYDAYTRQCTLLNKNFVGKSEKEKFMQDTLKKKLAHLVIVTFGSMSHEQKRTIKTILLPLSVLYSYYSEPLARYGRYAIFDNSKYVFKGIELNGISAHMYMEEMERFIKK